MVTSHKEVLKTIRRMPISVSSNLRQYNFFQYPIGKKEIEFIDRKIISLLEKGVIAEIHHESGEFISSILQ